MTIRSSTAVIAGALAEAGRPDRRSITFPRSRRLDQRSCGFSGGGRHRRRRLSGRLRILRRDRAVDARTAPDRRAGIRQGWQPAAKRLSGRLSAQTSDLQYNSIALAATWIGNATALVWQDRAAQVRIIDAVQQRRFDVGGARYSGNALTNAGANYGPSVADLSRPRTTVFLSPISGASSASSRNGGGDR